MLDLHAADAAATSSGKPSLRRLSPLDFLERSADVYRTRIAVVDGDVRRTYPELLDRVQRFAHVLRGLGVRAGERVAVLTEDQELSPNDAASILGVSRPLVVHRMDVGDLPFRYVGKHRRSALRDVLALKTKIDAQRAAMEALAGDAEDLKQRYGL